MKLIYIANVRLPTEKAHGIQIVKMCEAFSKNNIEVELVIPRRVNWIKEDPFKYYGVARIFKIKKFPCLDLITLDKYIGHLGLWIEAVTFNFFIFPYTFFKKTNIIYTRDKFFLPFCFFKKNLIFEAHDFPNNSFLYSPFLKRLKGIVVITQKLKKLYMEKGVNENKILVAPDAVDLKEFDIKDNKEKYRKELGLPENKIIIGYIGRLETMGKEKGIDVLIKALKILKKRFISTLLCIVGGGSRERIKEYQNLSQKIGLEKKDLIFTGQVKQRFIPKFLKSFDVLVLPFPRTERYAYYMSPLKLFECMASKKPIVASDLPSIQEILNKNNSVLVEPNSPEALAQGIKEVLKNPDFSAKISNQAFEDVQKYSWQKRAEEIYKLFKQHNKSI